MLIREEVVTRVTPDRAWALLRDPALHDLWNPRIVATEISSTMTPPALGYRYRVTYELSGKRSEFMERFRELAEKESTPERGGGRQARG